MTRRSPKPVHVVDNRIYLIRGQKVMLSADLAEIYQVTTGNLNLAVRRNPARFPGDFMFRLTREEFKSLTLHFAMLKRGGRGHLPYAFTEHGVAMLASVLKGKRASDMSIVIMRAFVRLRQVLAENLELAERMGKVEAKLQRQGSLVALLAEEIRKIHEPPEPARRRIGFVTSRLPHGGETGRGRKCL